MLTAIQVYLILAILAVLAITFRHWIEEREQQNYRPMSPTELGALHGMERKPNESEDEFTARVREKIEARWRGMPGPDDKWPQ